MRIDGFSTAFQVYTTIQVELNGAEFSLCTDAVQFFLRLNLVRIVLLVAKLCNSVFHINGHKSDVAITNSIVKGLQIAECGISRLYIGNSSWIMANNVIQSANVDLRGNSIVTGHRNWLLIQGNARVVLRDNKFLKCINKKASYRKVKINLVYSTLRVALYFLDKTN